MFIPVKNQSMCIQVGCINGYRKNFNCLSRCLQGMNRVEITELIIDILKVRGHTLRRHRGRKGKPLSTYANNALMTER